MKKVFSCSLAGLLLLMLSAPSAAVSREEFDPQRFNQLQEQQALVLVDIFANWCPTCARQRAILDAYREENPDAPLHILTVNYNTQREWVRHFEATRQSTLILFSGQERLWFTVAETSEQRIRDALDDALARQDRLPNGN